jgi:hypothetical protein
MVSAAAPESELTVVRRTQPTSVLVTHARAVKAAGIAVSLASSLPMPLPGLAESGGRTDAECRRSDSCATVVR